jgi:hypothetical protein
MYGQARRTVDQATLLAALRRYVDTKPPDRHWCNPATWLNQGRWDDEPAPSPRGRGIVGALQKLGIIGDDGLTVFCEDDDQPDIIDLSRKEWKIG